MTRSIHDPQRLWDLVRDKPNLFVSFSGGRSSARMAYELKTHYSDQYNMVFGFMNTGEEWEETLRFVDRCDREYGLGVIWLEAVVHPGKRASTHKVVSFATASRKGEPYEAVISKYGIPCQDRSHCTRELKTNVAKSYMRSIGWWGNCNVALGIRVDEPRRIENVDAHIVLPLAHWFPLTKPEINDWWSSQPFDLGIEDYQGNCKWCWKKSRVKLVRIAQETPEAFAFPLAMEAKYPRVGAEFKKSDGASRPDRTFFRQRWSTESLLAFANAAIARPVSINEADESGNCSESCEVFLEREKERGK